MITNTYLKTKEKLNILSVSTTKILAQIGVFLLGLIFTTALSAQEVYIGGYDDDGSSFNIAQIWEEDGTTHDLTDGAYSARVYDVFVDDGDVYAAGYEMNSASTDVAKVWKNGTPENLTDGYDYARANAVFVYDGDVYAAGYESTGAKYIAKLWKNGESQNLSDGLENAKAESVFVYEGDVYVVGITYDYSVDGHNEDSKIKIWKNGTEQDLTNGVNYVDVESIFVDNDDVYVAGREYNGTNYIAKLWKNGNAQNLTDGSFNASANSVFVFDGDVYVGGHDNNFPRLWKNGVEIDINYNTNHDGGEINSVYVSGTDVYLAGLLVESNYDNTASCYKATFWKNQQVEFISAAPSCTDNTVMYSVVVDDGQLSVEDFDYTENKITLYPNPVEEVLHIETKAENIQQIELFSITGQRLKTWENQSEIDLSSFSEGNYFVKISKTDNQTVTKQIIKK
ncbi:MAG TPA: T9SS type A sorting domain-containing protein [Flavobacteriaceae bacterium]|nr:T9SS type A sorting domain-containing protein [Flavobacteriaceae bacterium]